MQREKLNIALNSDTMKAIKTMAEQLHMNRADVIEVIIAVYFEIAKQTKGGVNK